MPKSFTAIRQEARDKAYTNRLQGAQTRAERNLLLAELLTSAGYPQVAAQLITAKPTTNTPQASS